MNPFTENPFTEKSDAIDNIANILADDEVTEAVIPKTINVPIGARMQLVKYLKKSDIWSPVNKKTLIVKDGGKYAVVDVEDKYNSGDFYVFAANNKHYMIPATKVNVIEDAEKLEDTVEVSEEVEDVTEEKDNKYILVTDKDTKTFAKNRNGLKAAYQDAAKAKIWVIYFVNKKGDQEIVDSKES